MRPSGLPPAASAVIPYYGYARQEKDAPREPISAKMVADILTTVGVHRIVTIDLHAPAIQGFFNIPVDHLTALDKICDYLISKQIEKPVIVSPDAGRAKTAEKLAAAMGAPFAIMIKSRPAHNQAKITHVIGEVAGRTPIIIEDMIDTGGTIINVVEGLYEKGPIRHTFAPPTPSFPTTPSSASIIRGFRKWWSPTHCRCRTDVLSFRRSLGGGLVGQRHSSHRRGRFHQQPFPHPKSVTV